MNQNKIKLMQITHDLDYGGLQQVIVNLCKNINKEIFETSVLCLRNLGAYATEVEKTGAKIFSIPQKNRTDYLSFLKVAKILRNERIDIIHTHNTQPLLDGCLGSLFYPVKKIIHTDHARLFPDKLRYMLAERFLSNFIYKVVGVSEHTSDNLNKYLKITKSKIITIPNGVDENRYQIEIDKTKKKYELCINNKSPVLGVCVRLTEQKGIEFLLKAMPTVISTFPDLALVIVGDGPLKNKLAALSRDLRLENNVFFVGGRIDIPELLKIFDIYVLPSLWEGLPIVILEAMAAGCPIIATNVGGVSSAIKNGYNGILIEPEDITSLTTAIIDLLKNDSLRTILIHNGKYFFSRNFSAKLMTIRYESLYLSD